MKTHCHYPLKGLEKCEKALWQQFEIQAVEDVNDRLGIIAWAEKSELQSLIHEMDGEKNSTAFCPLYRVKLSDSGIGMLCQVMFKALEITADPAGFINLEFF